jgi:putative oxidoreductase
MSKGVGIDSRWGITAVRVAMGLIVAVAGIQKWADGVGDVVTAFGRWGIPLPFLAAPFVALLETVGGILLVLGLGTRWLGLLFAIEFAVAAFWVDLRLMGWAHTQLALMLMAGGILLFLNGSGKAALDRN